MAVPDIASPATFHKRGGRNCTTNGRAAIDRRSEHRYVDAVAIADLGMTPAGTRGDDARSAVARHNCSGADNHVIADRDVRANDDAAAEPDVVADADRVGRFPPDPARLGIYRMSRGQELNPVAS